MLTNLVTKSHPSYNFSAPMDFGEIAGDDQLFSELIETRAFQRLRFICFLGGIDYLLVRSPNGAKGNVRYTRYQHSLGVARLALLYCDAQVLPLEDRRLVCAAALLHDIGHAPLSHSLEPIFEEVFGLEHHKTTEDIVAGRVPLGDEVYNTLRRNKINIERLIAIISGEDPGYHGFFSGPINFDTIEGILRARTYRKKNRSILSPDTITEAAISRSNEDALRVVDEFWSYKDQVYRYLINSPNGVLADFACQTFLRRHLNDVSASDYFVTEKIIFRKLPGLRELLTSQSFEGDIMQQIDRPIRYTVRRFFIDPSADFFVRNDWGRYKQKKEEKTLFSDRSNVIEPIGLIRDLFDDRND